MSAPAPVVAVLAGPNGAGKSTFAPFILHDALGLVDYVNADQLALGLSGFAPEAAGLAAGRVALERMRQLAARRASFALETTLASRSFASWLQELSGAGYFAWLSFLWLPGPEVAIARVRSRVLQGGHDIPEATIRRRYARGLENFFRLYSPLVAWRFYDSSAERPRLVATGQGRIESQVLDETLWRRLKATHGLSS